MIDLTKASEDNKQFISKVIYPGNQVLKINSFKLMPGYGQGELHLVLNVETKPVEEPGFEGFLIDKEDESKGRHKGQVGSIKFQQFAFKNAKWDDATRTWVDQGADMTYRDSQIYSRGILPLLKEAGATDWTQKNTSFETIEELVNKLNKDNPLKDKWFEFAVGAREYYSKEGYKRQDLFLIKATKPYKNFKLENNALTEVIKYNASDPKHLIPAKDVVSSDVKDTSITPNTGTEAPKAPTINVVEQPKEDELPF